MTLPTVLAEQPTSHANADANARAVSSTLTTSADGPLLASSANSAGATVCNPRPRSRLQAMTTLRA